MRIRLKNRVRCARRKNRAWSERACEASAREITVPLRARFFDHLLLTQFSEEKKNRSDFHVHTKLMDFSICLKEVKVSLNLNVRPAVTQCLAAVV